MGNVAAHKNNLVMSTYAPILAPAMELIEKLQGIIAVQQAEIKAMEARINELSAQLGLPPMISQTASAAAPVYETAAPAASVQAVCDNPAPVTAMQADPAASAGREVYADMPLVIDGKGAFEADYLNEYPNFYKLEIKGSRGIFTLNEGEEFYENMAFRLADMVVPVADYSVDQVPNGNGGFNMADLAGCRLVNIEPGELLLDGSYWIVTKKAQVQFKLK